MDKYTRQSRLPALPRQRGRLRGSQLPRHSLEALKAMPNDHTLTQLELDTRSLGATARQKVMDQYRLSTLYSPKKNALLNFKNLSLRSMTPMSKNVSTSHSHLTGKQHLCRLSIISDRDHSVMGQLVDISTLEMLQPGVMPFSLMTMPLGDDFQVSLVVERRKEPFV